MTDPCNQTTDRPFEAWYREEGQTRWWLLSTYTTRRHAEEALAKLQGIAKTVVLDLRYV